MAVKIFMYLFVGCKNQQKGECTMRKTVLCGLIAFACVLLPLSVSAVTEITLQYPYAKAFDPVMTKIKADFEKEYSQYRVKFLPAYKNYEDGAQTVLKQAVTQQLPDVSVQAINLQRTFVDRKSAVDLSPFIATEKNWAGRGYSPAMMFLGEFGKKQYGMAFAVSTPIVYYNEDLVAKAGGDPNNLPNNWEDIIVLAKKIDALGDDVVGIFHTWNITGNWLFQADILSSGGHMASPDDKQVMFNGPQGQFAAKLLHRLVSECNMPNLTLKESRQQFMAGKLGIWTYSTAMLGLADKYIAGRFKWNVAGYPMPGPNPKLPCGGNALLMFAKDKQKQIGAWEFMKFATGPIGATHMVKGTGYMPANTTAATDPNLLGKFYAEHPKHHTSLKQLPNMTQWYAFPGENSLKIIAVIKNHLQSIVDQSVDPEKALNTMAVDVQALMPK
jgi:multiple sugar transport system substrate-binding protein